MAESYFGELRTAVLRKEICIFPPTTSSYHRVIPVSDSQFSGCPSATPSSLVCFEASRMFYQKCGLKTTNSFNVQGEERKSISAYFAKSMFFAILKGQSGIFSDAANIQSKTLRKFTFGLFLFGFSTS